MTRREFKQMLKEELRELIKSGELKIEINSHEIDSIYYKYLEVSIDREVLYTKRID